MSNLSFLQSNITREKLAEVPTPEPTQSWYPVPHVKFRDSIVDALESTGTHIEAEAIEVSKGGLRCFGAFKIGGKDTYASEWSMMVGWRSSHDKSFPKALSLGSRVTVCSNLCFSGEVTVSRRHTRFIVRDLPSLVMKAVYKLGDQKRIQSKRIDAYHDSQFKGSADVHDTVVQLLDNKVITPTQIPKILKEYRTPSHEVFKADGQSYWRMFNAVTENFKHLQLPDLQRRGQLLHGTLDTRLGLAFA